MLYGSEVWGPISKPEFKNWDKTPTEKLQLEFCKMILKVRPNTPNNACRAELSLFPLKIHIQKRSIKFWQHLNLADKNSIAYKALLSNQQSSDVHPLDQLAHRYTELNMVSSSRQTGRERDRYTEPQSRHRHTPQSSIKRFETKLN